VAVEADGVVEGVGEDLVVFGGVIAAAAAGGEIPK